VDIEIAALSVCIELPIRLEGRELLASVDDVLIFNLYFHNALIFAQMYSDADIRFAFLA
jgi:hypothetical protein